MARESCDHDAVQRRRDQGAVIKLPPLPYAYGALEPIISAETMRLHHDVHHAGYVKALNELITEQRWPAGADEAFLLEVANRGNEPAWVMEYTKPELAHNLGQHLNHTQFWRVMAPRPTKPYGQLAARIAKDFRGVAEFLEDFVEEGTQLFGSGWVALEARWREDGGLGLNVTTYANGVNPLVYGRHSVPILLCDVWEHAYYLDYTADRAAYLQQWVKLINWDVVSDAYASILENRGR